MTLTGKPGDRSNGAWKVTHSWPFRLQTAKMGARVLPNCSSTWLTVEQLTDYGYAPRHNL